MSKWLKKFLQNGPDKPDNTDRFNSETNISVLSVLPMGHFGENLENESEIGPDKTDNTDKFSSEKKMSVLSVLSEGDFGKNFGNDSEIGSDKPDNTDRFDSETNMSVLSAPSYDFSGRKAPYSFDRNTILHNFEERIAIAEYDGQQIPTQAQRIAYQDAFIDVLNTLPYEDHYEGSWLDQRIKMAKEWLMAQGLEQPK